ncbi:short-chain dehydrogenase/reductase SDR [Gordonia bronchialis DSM 43247]|uniref:Short-chain dehydrogenase/reductase SDR n=1 Tax=Gordonia bronchialis (strain ATCC 25592 / DSM 43247 / BCRC 13721 / JCM 3198 / KCTC 3076 / NBRC 16047 / NCTC 10667) TaxID=526226 RepID=D0L4Q3_GORB4|nr:SDR family NAD(P)-dependent oxidoreductase [Gordonia bronchialis]ACY23278.1 short-chain dehydrogenase/reductase SDR [Gordonia bronchialis DSM 43247]MCC3321446.1 SDR family NAD(P)-dependent oxidoreductase [Gordonia bronchialis]QGS23332.1 SDR family NAD(P)-dependent oxidoreductase [Gordonia bronchialis]UAK36307.1 SDR family NAD(P)-dependent oxidoreductase [Gordonia bronchialis]STQ66249.1 Fatty acyl-CoA reductase [Gordonia bronchialis]
MAPTRTVVITGASDGIGAIAASELSGAGTDLIIVGRSKEKTDAVARQTGATAFTADYAKLDDVRALAEKISARVESIDVLMNNAGGTFDPKRRTSDGHEPNFQINHLGSFLLTNLLRDKLAAGSGALVLNTSSVGNLAGSVDLDDLDWERRRALELRCYGTGKLENILFTRGIAQRWSDDGIVSAAVHPGPAATKFGRDSFFVGLLYRTPLKRIGTITPEKGAAPLIALANRGADPAINGKYYSRFKADGRENPQARKQELIDGLWSASERLVGIG